MNEAEATKGSSSTPQTEGAFMSAKAQAEPNGEPVTVDVDIDLETMFYQTGMETIRPVHLSESGLLWLINKSVFHPRGYQLGLTENGQLLLMGNGSQAMRFGDDIDETAMMLKLKELMP